MIEQTQVKAMKPVEIAVKRKKSCEVFAIRKAAVDITVVPHLLIGIILYISVV